MTLQGFDELADEGETHAGAGERVVAALVERFEHVGQVVGQDALAGVADAEGEQAAVGLHVEADAPALGCELQGVGEQVGHDLLHIVGHVGGGHVAGLRLVVEGDLFLFGQRTIAVDNHAHEKGDIALLGLGGEDGGGLHLRDVEQLVDEREQLLAVALNHEQALLLLGHLLEQLAGKTEDDGERRAELVGDVGEERLAHGQQVLGGKAGALAEAADIDQGGDDGQQHEQADDGDDGNEARAVLALGKLILQVVVVEFGIGLAEGFGKTGVVDGVHHRGVAAQGLHGFARTVGFEGFGEILVVVAHGEPVLLLLAEGNGLLDVGHGLGVALEVEQVEGHILEAVALEVEVGDGQLLHGLERIERRAEGLVELAVAVVGVGELREVVDDGTRVAQRAGGLDGLHTVADGGFGLVGHGVDLAGHAEVVVGVEVVAGEAVGLDGLLDEVLGLVEVADADVDDGHVVIRPGERLPELVLAAELLGLALGLSGLVAARELVEAVAAVAEQGGMEEGAVASGTGQGAVDVGKGLAEVAGADVEPVGGKPDEVVDGVGRQAVGERGQVDLQIVHADLVAENGLAEGSALAG